VTATSEEYSMHLASILAASWPRAKVTDETALVWARLLQAVPENVAEEAVDRASRYDGPPSKRELEDVVRAARESLVPELPMAPETTGRLITLDEMRHGSFHLHRFWDSGETRDLRDPEEFERAVRPWDCDLGEECPWRDWTPPDPRLERLGIPEPVQ
jgi:hypothetical protein